MSEIKINLVKTSYGFSNLVFSDKPTEQMLAELKQNGWVYSRRQNRWYPGKTTGRNLAEIEKFAVEFKNKFNPETQNEVVKEPHVVSLSELSAEELREGMKYALNEVAQPLPKIDFTRENYNKLFPYSKIDTPIETVKIGAHQFEKLEEKDRKKLLQAVHDVLSNPDVIINEEKKSVFGDTENSHIYAKSYVINENTKAVQSVVVNIEDEYVSISTHKRDISNVVNKIKKPDQLLFAAAKVRLLAERLTNEKSVTVNPNRENEYVIPPQANITQPQEKSSEIPENHKTSFEQLTEKETKSVDEKINYVLEKLAKAGIEVVTDKEEFERILGRENILQKMSGSLSSEEQKRYFTFDEEDSQKFHTQIDDWQKNNINIAKLVTVGKIPPVMKVLNIADNPIEIQYSTLNKIVRDNPFYPNDEQGHKLSLDDIYAIPSQLADPVMVFKSRTRSDSFVFFTERKDENNNSILIPLAVNKKKGRIIINEITSMYGKDNEIDFVKKNIDENNLIYADKKRSLDWERSSQVQFLTQRFSNPSFDLSILTKERLVNFLSADSRKNNIQNMIADGTTYGFTHNGKIYLNPDVMNSEAAVHEYTHLWDSYTQKTNQELWQKGLSIFKNTSIWNEVIEDKNYADIKHDENLVLSECHARICGKIADAVLHKVLEKDGDLKKAEMIDWDKETWEYIASELASQGFDKVDPELKLTTDDLKLFLFSPMKDLFVNERKLEINMEKSSERQSQEQLDTEKGFNEYIHSEEFISKFGDWEKASRLVKLADSPAIIKDGKVVIDGEDITEEVKNLRNEKDNKVLRIFAKDIGRLVKGTYHNDDLNVDIALSMGNIDEIKNHHMAMSGHLEAIQYIPDIIKQGIYIAEESNEDKKKHPNIEKYKYFVSALNIGGVDYTCKSAVGVDKDGNHYYDQRLSQIEKGLLLTNLAQLMSRGNSEQSLINYDKRLLRICQCPQTIYLDGNLIPTKETVEAVKNGQLFLEKDTNGFQLLHDNRNNKIIGKELSDMILLKESERQSQEQLTTVTTKSGIKSIREQCRKILEKSDNEITREDKAILSQYEGAGGINEENRTNAGILNEFYTPNNLVEKVWQIADAYAPNAVTVLEPSAGVGKFANNRPNNIFTMHELDETSARINKILHPDANVIQGAYQKQFFDENGIAINKNYVLPQYDIVIGNPPYGEYLSEWKGKGEGKEFDRYEEYFISRGLDALKDENSVMAFVVPSGFLNSSNDKIKKLIAEKGELIDAYRLPEGTFPTTKVGTDIILMRSWKKEKNKLQKNWDDHSFTISEALIAEQKGHADLLSDNLWFKQHPEKILGEVKTRTNRFGKVEEYVAVHEGLTVQDELNKIDGMLHHVESPLSVDTVETASHFTDADKAVIQNKDISTEEKKVIPFIELAKVEMEKTPKTVFETEYAKEQNLETGISGLSARDFKYRWDRKTVINSETKEIIFCAGKNILAKIDSQGIFKKFYSDEKYKKLTPATKENLDVYLKSFETDAQNIAEQFLGTFENKYYFKDIKNSISNLFVYNPVTKNQSEISAYNSYVCATGIDIESNEELENSYDYYDAKHQRKIPLFYATAQSLYPKDRKIKIENIISDNKKILESINEDIESIDFDEKTMSYSELDNAWNERQNLKINAMLKFSNLNHDEFFETAKAYYQNQKEKIKELRIDTSSKRIKAEDANLIFEEIIKNPLDGEKIFKAGASFVSYVKNNSGYDVLIDDKRALFIDESQKQLSTYNNYFVTKELLNAFKEKFNGEINISDIPYTEENISLNKIIAEKNSSVAKNKTGTEIAEFFISSISSNETEIKKQIGLEVKIVSAGIISDVFIDDMNHKAFEFNKQNNLLKIYQPCFDREMIPGIEKAFIEKFHDLSIDKDITVENVRYNDHNGQTVVLNARPQRFIPEKEQLMTAQDFTDLYGTNWDIEERRFWEVTCYNNYVDTSKLTSEEFEKLKSSQNYFESSAGKYIHKVLFASGNIYDKLDSNEDNYRKGLISEASYNKNKELLQNSVPVKYKINEISVPVNSPFIKSLKINDVPIREKFLQWATGYANDECQNRRNSISNYAEAGIKRDDIPANISWSDVVDYIDGIELDFIRDDDLSEKEKSQIRNQKLNSRKETAEKLFTRYVQTVLTEEEKEIFVDKYNRCFNNNVEPDYSKLPLFVNGMNYFKNGSEFKLFEQQIKGAAFLSNKGNGLLAYEVGVGKTATGIVATVNQIQTGRASRPLIVVPKSVIKAWEKDINELFPSIPLNVLDNMSMKAIGKYYDGNHGLNIPAGSITLVTKEALNNFAFTAETIRNDLFNDYADLLSLNEDLECDNARIRATAQERIFSEAGCSNFVKNGDYILWEKTGFDHITVDEAHAFKNLFKVPRPKKGEVNEFSAMGSGNPSKRALKMFNITQLIQKHNENRNVFMLTATPFTNSPLEVYSMLTYIARKELEKQGIKDLYSFCQQYASTEYELAITQKNTVEYRNVMKGFNDVTSLQNTLKQYIDKVSAEEAWVIRPKKITHPVYLQPTELQNEIFDFAQNNLMNYQPKINEKRAPTLEGLNIMNLATLSPALVNEELLVDPKTHTSLGIVTPDISEVVECSPKLKAVCDTVVKNWKEHKDCGQVIYMNVGTEAFPYMIKYMENHGIPKEVFARIDGQEVVMGGKKVPGKTEARETVAQAFNDDKNPCKILIGSSAISEGMNLNGNSIALYNLTLGWNPTESVQVEGRIWRQGNQQGHVHIVYPLIENSCDPFLYQKHDEKMSRIDDLFSYKGTKMIIDGINPEDAKWALIKDPGRRADLEITEKLAVLNKEMLMYENQLSDYDSLIKSRKDFSERLESKKKQKEEYVNNYQQSLFSGNARRTEDEQQQGIERFNKSINDCEKQLSNITAKFLEMGIENSEDEITYSSKINEKKAEVQKKVDFLKSDENKTAVVEKYREQIQSELLEKNERLQKSPLHESILNDLVPFSVVEYQVQRERYENALKNKDKNPEEFINAEKRWNDFIKKRNNEEIEKPSSQKNETKDNDKKVLSETTLEKSEKPVADEKIITADAASEPKKNKSVIQLSLFEELSLGNIQEKKRAKEEEKMKTKPKTEAEKSIEALKQPQSSLTVEDYHKKWDGITTSDGKQVEEFTSEQSKTLHELRVALDDYFEKGQRPVNDRFIVGKTPLVLQKTGSDLTDVTVPVSVVKKAVETHGLSQKEVYETLAHIYNPILIFDSDKKATENKVESKLVLTDIFKDENPLALAVNVNSDVKLKDSNISVEVQDIRSVHDRTVIAKNGTDLIQKWANDGLCRYVDDKKITDWSSLARVYFPIELIQSDNNKILTKSELVNSHTEVEQHNIVPETSEERNAVVAKENEKSLTKEAGKDYEALKQYQQKYPVSTLDVSEETQKELKEVFKQIDSYINHGTLPKNQRFTLPNTPGYLQKLGADNTEISLPVSVVKKAVEKHNLLPNEIHNAIIRLYDPMFAFEKTEGENQKPSLLMITDEFKEQKPIALSLNINDTIKIKHHTAEVQDVRTIFDKTLTAKDGTNLIEYWSKSGFCKYVDDKKISDWNRVSRNLFPIELIQSDNNKILTKSELVNSQQVQKNQQRNVAFETSKEKNMTELKTYHTLKEEDVKNLEIISDEDFSDIVDSIILNDYKNIPNTIRLPNINSELAEKLGLEKDSAFIMKKSAAHIRPDRKGSYNQALDTEEYRMIPKVMRDATFALVDKRVKNFQILFDDKNDIKKINKIVFNKDELGNYLVTIGKVGRQNSISEKENIVVGVGVAPTISDLRFPKGQPATRLRPSPTTVNSNIAQNKEKSTIIQKNQPVLKYEDKIGKDNLEKIKKHFEKNIPDGAEKFKRLNISEARTVKEVVSEVKKTFGFDKLDKKYAAKLEKDFFDTCGIKVESKSDFIKRQNQNDRNQDAGKKDIEPDNDYPDYTDDCGMDY